MFPCLPIVALLLIPCDNSGWELKPDPSAEKHWTLKPDISLPLPGRADHLAFAEGNGPFMLVAPRDSTTREVYDLRTGSRTARFECARKWTFPPDERLSPDGKVWAMANQFATEVRVTNSSDGRELSTIKTETGIQSIGFVGNDRLLVIGMKGRDRVAQLFNTTAQAAGTWRLDAGRIFIPGATPNFAVSPGGKYLAVVGAKSVAVHLIADEKKVADLILPGEVPVAGRVNPPVGVAFSADGSELAAVAGKDDKSVGAFIVWSLANGRRTETAIDRPVANAGFVSAALAPILSGGWLIDGEQVWADGKIRHAVPQGHLLPTARLAVTPEQIVGVAEVKGTRNTAVSVISESVTVSGPARDGSHDGAREVAADARVGWPGAVGGFSPPFDSTPVQCDLKAKRAVGLTVPLDGRRWLLEADIVAVPALANRTIHVHDARTGAAVAEFNLPPKRLLFGETATSETFLTIGAPDGTEGSERLEMMAWDGRPIGAWRPHAGVKTDPSRCSIAYAAALDPARAVTVGNGRVTLWKLPEAKAVWTARMPEAAGGKLSPDGKALFVPHAGGVRAFDLETGETTGNLKGDPFSLRPGQDVLKAAVSGDGSRLAVYCGAPLGRGARVWDLTTGGQMGVFQTQSTNENPPIRFFGPRFLLVGENAYEVTNGRNAWHLKAGFTGVFAAAAPPDDRWWCALPAGSRWAVVPGAFPVNDMADFLGVYEKHGKTILRPDENAVALVINAPADAPAGWLAQVRDGARSGLRSAKLTESDDAPTVVRIRFSKSSVGPPVKLKWQGIQKLGLEETITRFAVESQAEITREGKLVWGGPPSRHEMRIKEWPQVNEITDDSRSGNEFFGRQVWAAAASDARFPILMLGKSLAIVDGQTWILPLDAAPTVNGITIEWPIGFKPQPPATVSKDIPPTEAVEGNLPAEPRPRLGVWSRAILIAAGCAVMLILGVGALAAGLLLARRKRPPVRNDERRQPGQANERRRKRS